MAGTCVSVESMARSGPRATLHWGSQERRNGREDDPRGARTVGTREQTRQVAVQCNGGGEPRMANNVLRTQLCHLMSYRRPEPMGRI